MLDIARVSPEFWEVAAELDATIVYTGRTDEAVRNHHWLPGGRRCYVYVLGCGGDAVYVGKSFDPHQRFASHSRREWWPEAEELCVFQVIGATRQDASKRALRLESAAIRAMGPLDNIAGVLI